MSNDQVPSWTPASVRPASTPPFVVDYDHARSRLRRITYCGVELPLPESFEVNQSWDETTLNLVFKGGRTLVDFIDSAADNIVDADPARRMLPSETER